MATIWHTFSLTSLGIFVGEVCRAVLAAGILGFVYELVVRESSRRDEESLLRSLRISFGDELRRFGTDLNAEIRRMPLQLDASVDLLSEERKSAVVKRIFSESIGSAEVADAVLKTVLSSIGQRDNIWRDTSHTVEFREEDGLEAHHLIRITDLVSYRATLHRERFFVGLLRQREILKVLGSDTDLDAVWVTPRGFVEVDGQGQRLVNFTDFMIESAKEKHFPIPTERLLNDGSVLFEYNIPEDLVGEEIRIQYKFHIVTDDAGPYLHLAVPCPALGLNVLLRNFVPKFKVIEERLFVPDPVNVVRNRVGDDMLELRTSQMILRGHGAVILLR